MRPLPLLLLCLLVACRGETTAPVRPVAPDLDCTSTITPASFHVLSGTDTLPVTNRYAIPHHTADTVYMEPKDVLPIVAVIVSHPSRCTTLYDSLLMFGAVKPLR